MVMSALAFGLAPHFPVRDTAPTAVAAAAITDIERQHWWVREDLPVQTGKRVDSQHFGADNGHNTLGDVFQGLFRDSGKPVIVHPDIAKQALPGGYMLRWNQSAVDFAADLADGYTGTIKVRDDKVLVLKRGSGESATGQKLPTIVLNDDENYEFDVELEPRFQFQKVSASYLDTDKGTLEREDRTSGEGKNGDALPHPFPSKDAASAAAASVAQAWQANAGQGMFMSAGKPEAVSGAPTKCQGFGTPITRPSGSPAP